MLVLSALLFTRNCTCVTVPPGALAVAVIVCGRFTWTVAPPAGLVIVTVGGVPLLAVIVTLAGAEVVALAALSVATAVIE